MKVSNKNPFKKITIEITIESDEELNELYSRLSADSYSTSYEGCCYTRLESLRDELKKHL